MTDSMNGLSNGTSNGAYDSHLVHDDSPHRKIEFFLTRAFEGGPIVRVELAQVGLHGDQKVGDWSSFEGVGPEHVTMQILERAMDDARMQKGSPRYVVTIFRSLERRQSDGRQWFTLAGGGHEFDGIEEMEGPTGTGLIAQLMRHNEASARLSLLASRDIMVEQRREIAELRAMVRHMMTGHFKLVETHEKLINEDHKRALDLRKSRFEEVKQEQIFGQIMMLLPIVMRLLAGDKSDTIRMAALEQQLRTLFGSMSEKQLGEIMGKLDQTQILSFLDLNKLMSSPPPSPTEAVNAKEKREKDAEKTAKDAEDKRKAEASGAAKPAQAPAAQAPAAQARPAPAPAAQPAPAPVAAQPEPAQPVPAPVAAQPEPAPVASAPVAAQPEPAPAREPEPVAVRVPDPQTSDPQTSDSK